MNSPKFSFQWLQLIFIIFSTTVTATRLNNIPRLSLFGERFFQDPDIMSETLSEDFQTYYYTQTLDHFNYQPQSYSTFQQRYVINSKYWGGANANAPIFAYLGAEEPLDSDLAVVGFLSDNAARFNALQLYIEHRYYGKSIPFGSREEAYKNASTRGYFNSAQAIADYAEIIMYLKTNFSAIYSPVIVVGGSYGGKLASWFRLKYPHIALGALASSAPILNFYDITPQTRYFSVVTKDFREVSETCYQTIRNSWSEIDKIAAEPNGLSILSKKFKTCKPLKNPTELKDHLSLMYSGSAQYNAPPRYPVTVVCGGIDGASSETDILGKIFAGLVAYRGNLSCYVNPARNLSETDVGWTWQRCSEMVMPFGPGNDTMFQPDPYGLNDFIKDCKTTYGVPPRPDWVTTYYGGHDIKLILQRFGSNIIFSNGLRDPYSSGGVLENISDTIVALQTVNGSHCLDILTAKQTDPQWLIKQRETEIQIIKEWINKYYVDLKALNL